MATSGGTVAAHPAAIEHLPIFITAPGQTDVLYWVMVGFIVVTILLVGNLYFQLHALPERRAHHMNKVQMEIVAILALLSLFTHNHLFWIAALLLAFIDLPDFSTPISSIAASLEKMSGRGTAARETVPPDPTRVAESVAEVKEQPHA